MTYLKIKQNLELVTSDIQWEFFRSSGPGGQNVNKVSTSVRARYDILKSSTLPDDIKGKLLSNPHRYLKGSVLIIESRDRRTLSENKKSALNKLIDTIRKMLIEPTERVPTKKTSVSDEIRLNNKQKHSKKKRLRGDITDW